MAKSIIISPLDSSRLRFVTENKNLPNLLGKLYVPVYIIRGHQNVVRHYCRSNGHVLAISYNICSAFCVVRGLTYFYLMVSDNVRGIPEFWLTAMKNVDHIAEMIQVHNACTRNFLRLTQTVIAEHFFLSQLKCVGYFKVVSMLLEIAGEGAS